MTWNNGRINDWSSASLSESLNGSYLNGSSLGSGKGITKATKDMIATVTWKLGGVDSFSNTTSTFYTAERGTDVYSSSKPTEWKGKIALIYPSDYGYATNGGSTGRDTCLSYDLGGWDSYSNCYNNDWLYNGLNYWTLTPYSGFSYYLYYISDRGGNDNGEAYESHSIFPSLYLSSNVVITGGYGTESDPFTLSSN